MTPNPFADKLRLVGLGACLGAILVAILWIQREGAVAKANQVWRDSTIALVDAAEAEGQRADAAVAAAHDIGVQLAASETRRRHDRAEADGLQGVLDSAVAALPPTPPDCQPLANVLQIAQKALAAARRRADSLQSDVDGARDAMARLETAYALERNIHLAFARRLKEAPAGRPDSPFGLWLSAGPTVTVWPKASAGVGLQLTVFKAHIRFPS